MSEATQTLNDYTDYQYYIQSAIEKSPTLHSESTVLEISCFRTINLFCARAFKEEISFDHVIMRRLFINLAIFSLINKRLDSFERVCSRFINYTYDNCNNNFDHEFESFIDIGHLYLASGDLVEALSTFLNIRSASSQRLGKYNSKTLEASVEIATTYELIGRTDSALRWFEKAWEGYSQTDGVGQQTTESTFLLCLKMLNKQDRILETHQQADKRLALLHKHGTRYLKEIYFILEVKMEAVLIEIDIITTQGDDLNNSMCNRLFNLAKSILEEKITIARKAFGESSIELADTYVAAALFYCSIRFTDTGKYRRCWSSIESLCVNAINIACKTLGPAHPLTLKHLGNICEDIYVEQGGFMHNGSGGWHRIEEIKQLALASLNAAETTIELNSASLIAQNISKIAVFLENFRDKKQERFEPFEKYFVQALDVIKLSASEDREDLEAEVYLRVGKFYAANGIFEKGEAFYLKALAIKTSKRDTYLDLFKKSMRTTLAQDVNDKFILFKKVYYLCADIMVISPRIESFYGVLYENRDYEFIPHHERRAAGKAMLDKEEKENRAILDSLHNDKYSFPHHDVVRCEPALLRKFSHQFSRFPISVQYT